MHARRRASPAVILLAAVAVTPAAGAPARALGWRFTVRGIVEGAYGRRWTGAERDRVLRWMAVHGMNADVHAPKDDLYQRTHWRDPYPRRPAAGLRRRDRAAAQVWDLLDPEHQLRATGDPHGQGPDSAPSRDLCCSCPADLVARVSMAIHEDPAKAWALTIKSNTVAIVSDGTAVLGLGDIGPAAALPVMEGKAMLFKEFGGVDAFPLCLDTKDVDEIVAFIKATAPTFGGINLEDIAASRCFEIERRLRAELDIPVFHDDQHGTAIVVLAALLNALRVVDKRAQDITAVIVGAGAAGLAGWLYLVAVQDLYSRRIVGWSMADHMRAELVVFKTGRAS